MTWRNLPGKSSFEWALPESLMDEKSCPCRVPESHHRIESESGDVWGASPALSEEVQVSNFVGMMWLNEQIVSLGA